jgi:DNA polymerase-2
MLAYKLAPYGRYDLTSPIVQGLLDGKANSAKDTAEYWAYKILVNAVYGLCASKHYRFNAMEVASAITFHAREILHGTIDYMNSMGYKVLYADTDSILVQTSNPEESKFLEGAINNYVEKVYNISNLKVKSEGVWNYIEFPRGSGKVDIKKRYFGNKDGKLEIVGLESVRGDWSPLAREMVKKICQMKAFKAGKEAVREYADSEVKKMFSGVYDKKLILTKSMSRDVTQYGGTKIDKNGKQRKMPIPQHVRAYRDALRAGFIPMETIQYGSVNYIICRGGIPKLANLVKTGEIDYPYFYSKQIAPILYRLGVNDVLLDKKNIAKDISVLQGDQATL